MQRRKISKNTSILLYLPVVLLFSPIRSYSWVQQFNVSYNAFLDQTLGYCSFLLSRLQAARDRHTIRSIHWLDGTPAIGRLQLLYAHKKKLPPPGSGVFQMTFEDLRVISDMDFEINGIPILSQMDGILILNKGFTENVPQKIEPSTPYDQEVTTQSTIDSAPHEVARVRLFTQKGNEIRTQFLHGTMGFIPEAPFENIYSSLLRHARQSGEIPVEIECTHSHPILEHWYRNKEGLFRLRLSSLSNSDIYTIRRTSERYPHLIISIRAVTPQNITYVARFRGGEQIDP